MTKDDALSAASQIYSKKELDEIDTRIIVNNELLTLARCRDPDGSCCQQFMPKEAYGDYINSTKPPCWCTDVGNSQSLLVVFAFNPIDILKNDPANEENQGYLKSQYFGAFGVNFQIHISEMMGNMS